MTTTDMSTVNSAHPASAETSGEARTVARILLSVFFFLAAWAGAVVTWGLPGLYIPALALVPVCWVGLIIISRG